MRAFAPGKLVLTGAYAVLHGAPAIVVATSRGAIADGAKSAPANPEVRAALGDAPAPFVDASALFEGERKLGLGASSAILVATLALRAAEGGADLSRPEVRAAVFRSARAAHASAQGGGSGVDIAAGVFGGALSYRVGELPKALTLPCGLQLHVFACPSSARTSELRARVAAWSEHAPEAFGGVMRELSVVAEAAEAMALRGSLSGFIATVRTMADALSRLGHGAGVPIVPPAVAELAEVARSEDAAFAVSGAGGGDVAVFYAAKAPSGAFVAHARARGLVPVDLSIDEKGMRLTLLRSAKAEGAAQLETP